MSQAMANSSNTTTAALPPSIRMLANLVADVMSNALQVYSAMPYVMRKSRRQRSTGEGSGWATYFVQRAPTGQGHSMTLSLGSARPNAASVSSLDGARADAGSSGSLHVRWLHANGLTPAISRRAARPFRKTRTMMAFVLVHLVSKTDQPRQAVFASRAWICVHRWQWRIRPRRPERAPTD
jgi:hypothetical protein